MLLLGVSVAVGLAMSGRLAHRPGLPAKLKHLHESATLVTLGLIVAHGRTAGAITQPGFARMDINKHVNGCWLVRTNHTQKAPAWVPKLSTTTSPGPRARSFRI